MTSKNVQKILVCSFLLLLSSNLSAQVIQRLPEAHIAAPTTTTIPTTPLTITNLGGVWGGDYQGTNTFNINGTGFVSGRTYTAIFTSVDSRCPTSVASVTATFQSTTRLRVTAPGMPNCSSNLVEFAITVREGSNTSNAQDYTYTGYTGVRNGSQCMCQRCFPEPVDLDPIAFATGCTARCKAHYGIGYNCS